MTRRSSLCAFILTCGLVASPITAGAAPQQQLPMAADQIAAVDPPAHIALVDGAAVLERDGQTDPAPANMPLLAGDRVRTQAGRVEVLFGDGATLHLDSQTTVDFQSDELVRLLDGRIRLAIPGPNRRVGYRIDASPGSVEITQPGEYRIAVLHSRGDELELAVLRGAADLVNDNGRTALRAGERAICRAEAAPSYAYAYNSASWDAFDRWSELRRNERLGISTQYLPEPVRPYASSFDRYGDWRYEASYGYVWYPTVAVGWRPYYNGAWATLRPYGWTWIGADPWAWPTHHYGRWGISGSAWFWIPGRSWGAAWVSWAYAPGYVSWCPLGWNNRPALQIYSVNAYHRGYDPWRAWTVVPQRHFGVRAVNVGGVAVRDPHLRGAFVARNTAPDARPYAVPRSSTPIRAAGTPGPRGGSTVYTNLSPSESRVGGDRRRVMIGGGAPATGPDTRATASAPQGRDSRSAASPRTGPTGPAGTVTSPGATRILAPPQSAGALQNTSATPPAARDAADDRWRQSRAVPRDDRSYASSGVPASRGSRTEAPRPEIDRGVAPSPRTVSPQVPIYRGEMPQRPSYGATPDDRLRSGARAEPRAVPSGAAASPNVERRSSPSERPSGPPPSASRDAGPRPDGGSAGRARSGGQPAQGAAVPRSGGGGRR